MTEPQRAYLAGLIDGEGCICITARAGGTYSSFVQVAMCNPSAILFYYKLTSLGSICIAKNRNNYLARDTTVWTVQTRDGAKLLIEILPYLIVKKQQAELYLESVEHRKHWKKTELYKSEQKVFYDKMRVLNKIGKVS